MRSLRTAAVLGILLVCLLPARPGLGRADEPREGAESRPELILPGDHRVRPGEWIELHWTRADAISELEILLSLDGGRHYAVCISPQLDPERRAFRWQVPATAAGDLRMRIRFNRGGREIEGPPTAPLHVATAEPDQPQPLGLPPVEGSATSREPRPAGERSETPGGRTAAGVTASGDAADPECEPAIAHGSERLQVPDLARSTPCRLLPFMAPRTLPLRS